MQTQNSFEALTPKALKVIDLARAEAERLNLDEVQPAHLLIGLIQEGTTRAAKALRSTGISLKRAREEAKGMTGIGERRPCATPLNRRTLELIESAKKTNGQGRVDTEDLLLALIESEDNEPTEASILKRLGVSKPALIDSLRC